MESTVMGKKEQVQFHTISKLSDGKLTLKEAQLLLQKSDRTVRRWLRSYEKDGRAFINHGNKGKVPINKTNRKLNAQIMGYMEFELFDFNMLHAIEKSLYSQQLRPSKFRGAFHR